MHLKDAKLKEKVYLPLDSSGYLNMDYNGDLLAKKQWVEATVISDNEYGCRHIAFDKEQLRLLKNLTCPLANETKFSKKIVARLDQYMNINADIACLPVPIAGTSNGLFLLALIGAGAVINQATKSTANSSMKEHENVR